MEIVGDNFTRRVAERRCVVFFRAYVGRGGVSVVDGLGKRDFSIARQAVVDKRGDAVFVTNGVGVFNGAWQTTFLFGKSMVFVFGASGADGTFTNLYKSFCRRRCNIGKLQLFGCDYFKYLVYYKGREKVLERRNSCK
jgi:hypothetical protein